MAKIFISLLAVLVVLNGMTFLIVVNQSDSPTEAEPAANAAGGRTPAATPTASRDITQLKAELQSLRTSMTNLTRKVDDLSRKLPTSVSSAVTRAVNSSLAMRAPASPGSGTGGPAATREGPVDYSRVTEEADVDEEGAGAAEEYPEG